MLTTGCSSFMVFCGFTSFKNVFVYDLFMKIRFNKKEYNVELCDTLFKKFRGLMFRNIKEDEALLFSLNKVKKVDLHTLFVFYPIDIHFLNENKKVIHSVLNVRPFTPYVKGVEAKYVLEIRNTKNI